jgi:hypothetical protein
MANQATRQRNRARQASSSRPEADSHVSARSTTSAAPRRPDGPPPEPVTVPSAMLDRKNEFVVLEVRSKLQSTSAPRQSHASTFTSSFLSALREDDVEEPLLVGQPTASVCHDGKPVLHQRYRFGKDAAAAVEDLLCNGVYSRHGFLADVHLVGGPRRHHLLVVGAPYYSRSRDIETIISKVPNVTAVAEVQHAEADDGTLRADAFRLVVTASGPLQREVPLADSEGRVFATLRLDKQTSCLPVVRHEPVRNEPLLHKSSWAGRQQQRSAEPAPAPPAAHLPTPLASQQSAQPQQSAEPAPAPSEARPPSASQQSARPPPRQQQQQQQQQASQPQQQQQQQQPSSASSAPARGQTSTSQASAMEVHRVAPKRPPAAPAAMAGVPPDAAASTSEPAPKRLPSGGVVPPRPPWERGVAQWSPPEWIEARDWLSTVYDRIAAGTADRARLDPFIARIEQELGVPWESGTSTLFYDRLADKIA